MKDQYISISHSNINSILHKCAHPNNITVKYPASDETQEKILIKILSTEVTQDLTRSAEFLQEFETIS